MTVQVAPDHLDMRNGRDWRGMGAEILQMRDHKRLECSFCSPRHMLAMYECGVRRDGESYVEGLAPSKLRSLARKLILVPAGHAYREWHEPRAPIRVSYFYFDLTELSTDVDSDCLLALAPRLFVEDAAIASTATKLTRVLQSSETENRLYVEALGTVLLHEIICLNRGTSAAETHLRGGLAAWQERMVRSYVEEHLTEQIPLATLAGIVRLSTYYFCRAFKQSFGIPPHRYHTQRRIEQAKIMLAEQQQRSITEIAVILGFSETSSFTTAFRKVVGQTPSRYQRSLG